MPPKNRARRLIRLVADLRIFPSTHIAQCEVRLHARAVARWSRNHVKKEYSSVAGRAAPSGLFKRSTPFGVLRRCALVIKILRLPHKERFGFGRESRR